MHLLERLRFRTLSTPRPFCAVQPNGRPYRRSLSQAEQVVRGPAPASITNAPVHANCRRLAAVDAAELTIKVPGDRGGVACRTMECDGGAGRERDRSPACNLRSGISYSCLIIIYRLPKALTGLLSNLLPPLLFPLVRLLHPSFFLFLLLLVIHLVSIHLLLFLRFPPYAFPRRPL